MCEDAKVAFNPALIQQEAPAFRKERALLFWYKTVPRELNLGCEVCCAEADCTEGGQPRGRPAGHGAGVCARHRFCSGIMFDLMAEWCVDGGVGAPIL